MAEPSAADKKILERMKSRWKLSSEAEADNRKRGLDALKFRSGGKYQWDSNIYDSRTLEKRPTESYNQIPQFVHKITNNMRMNMPQVKIVPKEDGDKEIAEILEGMCRDIQSSSEAEVAYDTATDMQVTIGWGYWRILTEYEDEEDDSEDQVIKIKRIANPFMVYDDPYALEQDRSDRRFAHIISDRPVDDHNADNPDDPYDDLSLQALESSIGDSMPGWANSIKKTIREVEYFEVTEEKGEKVGEKQRIKRKVMWYKCTADKIMERREWVGRYIPLVCAVGEELNIEGNRELSGIVEGLIAPQKQFNIWTNAATEAIALAPKSPFIGYIEQFAGLEHIWDNANTKAYPFLPVNMVTEAGQPIPLPQRQSPNTDISGFIALVQGAQQNLYSTSGIYPASLGQQSNETSGRAINARKVEGDLSNFHFPDNNARAIRFTGRILVDLIPKVYDTGRTVMKRAIDGKVTPVRVNEEFQDKRGRPKKFDLSKGKFDVAVTTGPSYQTKREQSSETMVQISQAYPPLWEKAGDLMVGEMDFHNADKLAERLKPPGLPMDEEDNPIPPQVQAQMQQAQQMIDQLTETVHQQADELESKKQEFAAKELESQTKVAEAGSKVEQDRIKGELEKERNQLQRESNALEVRRIALQESELQYKTQELRINSKLQAGANSETALADPDFHEGPSPMQTMIETLSNALSQGLGQVAQITAQSSEAIVQSNMLVAQSNAAVAQAINTPKTVNIARGENGLAQGAVVSPIGNA